MQLVTPDTLLRQNGASCAAASCGVASSAATTSAEEAMSVLMGAPLLAIDLPRGAQRMICRIVPVKPNLSSHTGNARRLYAIGTCGTPPRRAGWTNEF